MVKRLSYSTVGFLVGALLLWSSSATAQTMEFGEEEAEETMGEEEEEGEGKEGAEGGEVSDKAREFLEEGKDLYKKEKYDEASLVFFRVVNQEEVSSPGAVPEARYQLGKTLIQMKLYQGALSQFSEIVDQGQSNPYYVPTLNGLLSLSEVIPAEPQLRENLASYADLFPDQVPNNYRDRYAYLTGRHFYSKMNVEQATRMFEAVKQGSKFYAKARYILGTTHVANYNAKPAVAAFKDVLRFLTTKEENSRLSDEEKKLKELTNLAMARVFYSTGDYETSLKYFDKINRGSPRWPQALFEESWAYFQIDRYNKALGNLHSLNSPFFQDSYFPEGPILAAVIYFYNCKYERVQNQLEEFEYRYEPLKDEMQAVLDGEGEGAEMYKWYRELKAGNVDYDEDVRRVVEAALEDKQVRAKFELVDLIDDEIEKIKSMPSSWKTSGLGQALMQEANLAQSFATEDAGSLARQRLNRRVEKLSDLINQKKEINFEIAKAKRGQLSAEIPSAQEIEANRKAPDEIDVGGEEMYWKFNGEYWRDELGHYYFNIGSQCQR